MLKDFSFSSLVS